MVMDMAEVSPSQNKPLGGGLEMHLHSGVTLKIAPLWGPQVDFNQYIELAKFQEYISDEYCLVCSYFKATKGHFGTCKDLPTRKAYDGAKKGSSCCLWRLKTIFAKMGLIQQLPEKPILRPLRLIVKRKRDQQYKVKRKNYWNKDIKTPWFWRRGLPKFVYDYLLAPEPLPDSLNLKEINKVCYGSHFGHKRKGPQISPKFRGNMYVNANGEPYGLIHWGTK